MDVDSLTCSTDGTAVSTRCAEPLKSNEVTLRIVRAKTPSRRATSELGESLLDPSRRSGTLATIFFDRVEWLARSADVPAGTVLARAIAHELGHLLLGATGHSRDGLMRAVWTRDELRRDRTRDWRFAPADAARLRAGGARREPIDTLVWATE